MYEAVIAELNHLDGPDLLAPLVTDLFCGNIALVSSFGAESAVLLHMAASIDRSLPVITLDTGKLFSETIAYRAQLTALLGLTDLRIITPRANVLRALDGAGTLHRRDPDRCCHIRKVLPLENALTGFKAWISGRKRYHGGLRADVPTLEETDERLKIDPLARFTRRQMEAYLDYHDLPRHPLVEKGYFSIGCAPCTVACGSADNPRAGRWSGLSKMECGIHRSPAGAASHNSVSSAS
ncbi:MAG: phosphoadenylyl-sulfate reductase [Mesorhizobium sp.]|uniref:phosphoadenylyl-sulfate reductase n=1 Tax=Mesorhizobium sp. TaxID=1871066 RepID=UPI000FEAA1E4|nr:phosphoadenylyl-sulfate reductase [Mesorhizobium sp.]RWM23961.1 MAG: phosphoadenylyl-sulfate reductase [Mesorhizobium sp.]TIP72265.1 MAG: phosphoadenylyl-sulfate reductase [Mesorhizobium sp.]TIQ14821.1 MAG: phosphoadenylyl-sulfate reductase [Mesorhizobium sp.]TIR54395.1 MAG: phosphoadenylyl-sulfate reductase [Mesorhizobium sp.]TJV99847.1 MAG: phosphoadenylyl-sulfate reductase [Mesorhizobium sp.]